MKLLALDIGKKRIGVAISSSGIISREYETILNTSFDNVLARLREIIAKEEIEKLIVGLPKSMDGQDSDYTKYVREFSRDLKKHLKVGIVLEDERLTTNEAKRQLINLGASDDEISSRIDQYAAKLILDQYLGNY